MAKPSSYGVLPMYPCKFHIFVRSSVLAAACAAFSLAAAAQPSTSPPPDHISTASRPDTATILGKLPPLPHGKSTVLGGEIRNINPVLDQFTLNIFGGRSMKILFDERTQVFRNGVRIPVLDLRPAEHASVETALDGSKVFALRIHMLTHLPQGQCQGQVLSYDPRSGALQISSGLSQSPITLNVPSDTPVVRMGQSTFSAGGRGAADLAPGALVRVRFMANGSGRGVATHVSVLATPGSRFLFSGVLIFLDVPNGQMTILDPRNHHRYQVAFSPSQFAVSGRLREGSHVRVQARFNGTRYIATSITIE